MDAFLRLQLPTCHPFRVATNHAHGNRFLGLCGGLQQPGDRTVRCRRGSPWHRARGDGRKTQGAANGAAFLALGYRRASQ